jgi:transcriptional regulator with XRE-family HTH domain
MAKTKEKEEAIALRKRGMSIGEIARKLLVSKSTASGWCRDISLSSEAISKIAKKGKEKSIEGLMRYSESVRQQRIKNTQVSMKKGATELGHLSDRDVYCIGLGIYWGEGYKTGNQEFGFTNSDPQMISFYIRWLQTVFLVKTEDLILRVSINQLHRNRIEEVEAFWVRHTEVPLCQFTKPSFVKTTSKKMYKDHSTHMGTLRIKVRRGTVMRREVLGAIKSI